MGKIEQNKEKKRQAILKAAQITFLSEGYTLANMDKIASEAQMTKQTVYRYFSSKIDLFEQTLGQMGKNYDVKYAVHLEHADNGEALLGFAKEFICFHLSDEHIATIRLLVAESTKAPQIMTSFMSIGPDKTDAALSRFFAERFDIEDTEVTIRLWLGMLLSFRTSVLLGMPKPGQCQIENHAADATSFLLLAIENAPKRKQ